MASSDPAPQPSADPTPKPSTIPRLSLDIIYNIGLTIVADPFEQARLYSNHDNDPEYLPDRTTLHRLTYLSKATKDVLEPLLYRHFTFTTPQDVMSTFITLVQRPELRQHTQYIASFSPLSGPAVRKRELPKCKKLWSKRCPSDKPALMRLLDNAGLHKLAWSACMFERTKQRFMFSPDFKHDGILEIMFAAILFLTPNVTTFIWRDMNTNPKAFLLDHILDEVVKAGVPLMPKLSYLNTEKSAFVEAKQAQFFTPHINMWDNLHTLYLNDVDLDVEFIEMLARGDFKKDRPVKELHILCVPGSEKPGSMSSFPPGFELSSTGILDPNDLDKDKEMFDAFPNLEHLSIRFVHHQHRYENGSLTLKAFLHAVGCPKFLQLEGHKLPFNILDTGVTHKRLAHLKVREYDPQSRSRTLQSESLLTGLNSWWGENSPPVPNLTRIDLDHYSFEREDLSDEERTVWKVIGEDEWEDDSSDGFDDDDESLIDEGEPIRHVYDNVYYDPQEDQYFEDGYSTLMAALQEMGIQQANHHHG
ncbi:hypothetical protein FSPOR_6387 [Fusarium sporotrichioides]|uniref:Uncharacterized protein n=1 Tax=Fusarium sporotrichioides TaxID=5514 RepID=A0A395S3W7_FUSSP|nr:hypothetical protein FSPOR_6387 [Fusarium sporotrichioides]